MEEELPNDTYLTIHDFKMIREMNRAQFNIDPETGEEIDTEAITTTNNRYNLWPRPTKRIQKMPCYKQTNYKQYQNHMTTS